MSTRSFLRWLPLFLALSAIGTAASVQEIRVQASVDRTQVALNEVLQLNLQVNGTQNVPPPDLKIEGFRVQYIGSSTQISVVNGLCLSSIIHRYTLFPQKAGRQTLGPISVEVEGKTFQTQPITIEVIGGSSPPRPPPEGQGPAEEEGQPPDLGDALQLELGVDKTKAYLNEAIPARLQLLMGGVAVRGIEMPTLQTDGFLVKPMGQPSQARVMVGEQPYTLLEFDTTVTPIRTGKLSLGPASINCQITLPLHRLYPITLEAKPVAIEVLPLPKGGKSPESTEAEGMATTKRSSGRTI